MKRIIKEPLFQFVLIGISLFFLYGLINSEDERGEITIDDALIGSLSKSWESLRSRKPTLEELLGLIDKHVEQEVFYLEALNKNLDANDEIIKRRLAQKMEFISDELAETLQPTEEVLRSYFERNKENYRKPAVYSLSQVFFSENKRTDAFEDAEKAMSQSNPVGSGDRLSLPEVYNNTNSLKLASDFGTPFAQALDSLPIGKWAGPISSGFGVHIIYINTKENEDYFEFEDVARNVSNDYNYFAANDFKAQFISQLLKSYKVNLQVENQLLKTSLSEKY
jgi:parvulin-like peptidyl-prolyl cis-trans isomerase-like protein